jgi:hypothetical protein
MPEKSTAEGAENAEATISHSSIPAVHCFSFALGALGALGG